MARNAVDLSNSTEPCELSRSRVENFVKCKAFWLEQLHK